MQIGVPMLTGYWDSFDLQQMGLRCGEGCLVSKRAEIFNAEYVVLGNNVRIDGDVFISSAESGVIIENGVHISRGVHIFGMYALVVIGRYSAISPGAKLFSGTDDFSAFVGCTHVVPDEHRKVLFGSIMIEPLVAIGANTVVLPGAMVGLGAAVGANSLVGIDETLQAGGLYCGSPARFLKWRGGSEDQAKRFNQLMVRLS